MRHMNLPHTPWLLPEEHGYVVERLLRHRLIKHDNARSLPLKSGGKTDIYLNLRDMRSDWAATDFLTELYAMALRRLNIKRFVEVPAAVSGLAGTLSRELRMPYITIRDEAKFGRASSGKIIGEYVAGDRVVILDDVITDGGSKIDPWRTCRGLGLNVLGLVVLVDRQQGWRANLQKHGVNTNVWAGMTLHDIRRQLIEMGLMQRCNPENEAQNPLVIALDNKSWEEVLPIVDPLRTTGCIFKVNDMLFDLGIANLLPELSVYGRVLVDFKLHDIPNTVENACKHLRKSPRWAVTVHASGGPEMVKAARRGLPAETKALAVTVLTSIDEATGEEVYHCLPREQVRVLAKIAMEAGADGLVCSAEEVEEMSQTYPGKTFLVPGLRSPGAKPGDQKRVDTFVNARAHGATHFVGGRQFTTADNPVEEVLRVLKEELKVGLV